MSVARSPGSGPKKKTVTTPAMIRKVQKRIERNPRRSGRKMARELNISQRSMQRMLKDELGLKPLKFQKAQDLNDKQ